MWTKAQVIAAYAAALAESSTGQIVVERYAVGADFRLLVIGDEMLERLMGLESKLDKILQLLGATQTEEAPADEIAPEAPPNDNGD